MPFLAYKWSIAFVQVLRNSSLVDDLYGLTQFEEYVWWTDRKVLRRAPKRSTAARSTVRLSSSGLQNPAAIQVVHPYRQPEQGVKLLVVANNLEKEKRCLCQVVNNPTVILDKL